MSNARLVAADAKSVWLKFSVLVGFAIGALTTAVVYLSPALAAAWLIARAVRAL